MARRLPLLLAVTVLAAACAYETSGTTTTTRPAVVALPPATSPAAISIVDQRIEGSSLVVESVSLPAAGFIVVREDDGGSPGPVIGVSELLPAGIADEVPVPFFVPIAEGIVVHATVQIDMDSDGLFSYEPPDFVDTIATLADGEPATAAAELTLLAPLGPADLTFAAQTTDGTDLSVASVTLPAPGFVVLQKDLEGALGEVVGVSELLPLGTTTGVTITVDRGVNNSQAIHAVVYVDRNENGLFDPGEAADDIGVREDGSLAEVSAMVTVVLRSPAALEVSDQDTSGETVVIDSVTLPADGFVEILTDQGGAPGTRIGVSPLRHAGDLTDVTVTLDKTLTTGATLWARLWVDYDGSGTLTAADLPASTVDGGDPIEASFKVTIKKA